MFKLETTVYAALVSLLIGVPVFAQTAAAPPAPVVAPVATGVTPAISDVQFGAYYSEQAQLKCRPDPAHPDPNFATPNVNKARCAELARAMNLDTKIVDSNDCNTIRTDFQKAKSTFTGACDAVGYESGGVTGAIACSYNMDRCKCLNAKQSDDGSGVDLRCGDDKATKRSSSQSSEDSRLGLIDLAAEKRSMKLCPEKDSEDKNSYEAQAKESQTRVKQLKDELNTLQTSGADAQKEAAQKVNESNRKSADIAKETAHQINEIKKQATGAEQQAVAEVAQLRLQMDQVDAQVRAAGDAKMNAQIDLQNQRTAADLQCNSEASATVEKKQEVEMSKIKAGKPSGDFNSMMQNVGITSRAAWEKVAWFYYKICLRSQKTISAKASYQKAYDAKIQSINTQITTAMAQRHRLEENISTTMSSNGCGTGVGESKLCQAIKQANTEMAQAQQDAYNEQQANQQEGQAAAQDLAAKNQLATKQYAEKQQDLADENARMNNYRAYLDLKHGSGNGKIDPQARRDLYSSNGQLRSSASQYAQCCVDNRMPGGDCPTVMAYLKSMGQPAPQSTDSTQVEPESVRPTVNPTDPASTSTPTTIRGGAAR